MHELNVGDLVQAEVQVPVGIGVGGRARIVGTRSEVAAQVEAQVHV